MQRFLAIFAVMTISASAAAANDFDGQWDVTLICPKASDGALGFTFEFPATVRGGILHGEHGQANEPGWLKLDGPIQADGNADMIAQGVTGQAVYNVNSTARGVAYRHPVTAHFAADHGDGHWTVPTRVCAFTFKRN